MRIALLQFATLVVTTVVIPWNATAPLVGDSIKAMRSIGKIPVCLQLSGNSSTDVIPWVLETPISCLLLRVYPDVPMFPVLRYQYDLNNVLFLAPSWPWNMLLQLRNLIIPHYPMLVLVILSLGEDPPSNSLSCAFIWISDTTIDVPHESCIHGGGRTRTPRLSGDFFRAQDESRFPKNISIYISMDGYNDADRITHDRYPEAAAYLNALPVLNVTAVFTEEQESKDVIIEPTDIFAEMLHTDDIGGVYTCIGHGFYSGRVSSNSFNVISWPSLTVVLAALMLLGAVITASFHFTGPYRLRRISGLLLFLVASSVGRSPVPINATAIPLRGLLLSWLFGTFIIGAYVQSQITSEYNVPAYSPAVETIDDLQRMTSSGMILPCMDSSLAISFLYFKGSDTHLFGTLRRLIQLHGDLCISDDKTKCFSRARDMTHVYIAPADFPTTKVAQEWGLSQGKDVLLSSCRVAPARKDFRYVLQHRRLVLALSESGLTLHEERSRTWNHAQVATRTVTFSFSKQFQVLILGCAGSTLILLCELLFSKLAVLKHCRAEDP